MIPRSLAPMMCPAFADGKCKYGDDCRLNHDVEAFLAAKPPNISERCPVFEAYGRCSAGIKCRFSDCHTRNNGRENVVDEEKYALHKEMRESPFPPNEEILNQLAKKKYPFGRAKKIVKTYEAVTKQRKEDEDQMRLAKKEREEAAMESKEESVIIKSEVKVVDAEPETKKHKQEIIWAALAPEDRKPLDLKDKLYLAPLTTIGNLPFRRVCVELGCDVTCGEMAVTQNVNAGKRSEWVLMKRHPSEKYFGVQIAASKVAEACYTAQLAEDIIKPDFVDLNCGCPIDLVCNRGMGSALLERLTRLKDICIGMSNTLQSTPFSIKVCFLCFFDPFLLPLLSRYAQDAKLTLLPSTRSWPISRTGAAAPSLSMDAPETRDTPKRRIGTMFLPLLPILPFLLSATVTFGTTAASSITWRITTCPP